MPLTRIRIVKAAIRLADAEGIEALSMRRLAKNLGVEAMSLYNHVANKGELIDAMLDEVLGRIEVPPEDTAWDDAIRDYAGSVHDTLIDLRWAMRVSCTEPA